MNMFHNRIPSIVQSSVQDTPIKTMGAGSDSLLRVASTVWSVASGEANISTATTLAATPSILSSTMPARAATPKASVYAIASAKCFRAVAACTIGKF